MLIDVQPEVAAYFRHLESIREELSYLPDSALRAQIEEARIKGANFYAKTKDFINYLCSDRGDRNLIAEEILNDREKESKLAN